MTNKNNNNKPLSTIKKIFIVILVISEVIFFVFLLLKGVHIIVSLLIISFLFLFFLGLILKTKYVSFNLFKSHKKYESPLERSKKEFKVDIPKGVKPDALKTSYSKPLVRKCENCGFILPRFGKKCPNCGYPIE
jgi:hypothetical protein